MNIVLIGYRCSGKTSVGKGLAGALKRPFLDTDDLVEHQAGQPIDVIVPEHGWDTFRDIEKRVIKEVSKRDDLVMATGGGVVLDKENVRELKKRGLLVWLKGSAKVLKKRMEQQEQSGITRPSLTGLTPLAEIEKVLKTRTPLYEQAGDLTIDADLLSVTDTVATILKRLPERVTG